jgi:hypothetical protein
MPAPTTHEIRVTINRDWPNGWSGATARLIDREQRADQIEGGMAKDPAEAAGRAVERLLRREG